MDEALVKKLKGYATEREEPSNHVYAPPRGHPILALPPSAKIYTVGEPTRQTDLLAPYERRHVIPIAMLIAPIFDVTPVPDDVFRAAPEYAKSNLFCIFSRSGIQKHGSKLNWDAVVVVVQKLCIVRVNCSLDPTNNSFSINRVFLWSRKHQDYQMVEDPQSQTISPTVLPYILDRYVNVEKIA